MNAFAVNKTNNVAFGNEFPAAWYQSINPLLIILLSPVFAWFFTWVNVRKLPFNDIKKFGVGLIFMALAFIIMLPAANATELNRVSPMFLVLFYFLSTVAELFLSPVGLSSMSKLAPATAKGLVMGVWFLATSNGDYIAGRVHGLTGEVAADKLFLSLAVGGFAVSALMFLAGSYFTRKVPYESLIQSARPAEDQEVSSARAASRANSISGYAIAGFATAVSLWPGVLADARLGLLFCVILVPASVILCFKGFHEARRHVIGGYLYASLGFPIALGALVYALVHI
jgi:hypothetical protein